MDHGRARLYCVTFFVVMSNSSLLCNIVSRSEHYCALQLLPSLLIPVIFSSGVLFIITIVNRHLFNSYWVYLQYIAIFVNFNNGMLYVNYYWVDNFDAALCNTLQWPDSYGASCFEGIWSGRKDRCKLICSNIVYTYSMLICSLTKVFCALCIVWCFLSVVTL